MPAVPMGATALEKKMTQSTETVILFQFILISLN